MTDKTEDQQQPVKQYLSSASPGQRLRLAREAAGLSRGEVALHMRINERKVAALEEDNYELFPSETFVSGYLRSYAKVLGLPEGDFVRPVSSTQLPPELTPTRREKKQASSMDLPVRMVTYLIIVAVIASIAMWWISQRQQGSETPVEPPVVMQQETIQEAMPQQATAAESEAATAEDSVESPAVTETETPVPEPSVGEEKAVPAKESSIPAASPVQPPAQKPAPDPAVPPLLVEPATAAAVAEPEKSAPPIAPLTEDMPQSKLALEYQQDSWTEVVDNAGRQIVYGLMRAGQAIEIKGEAPFKIFLGFAEGVTIYYNGVLFDHSAFQRGEVARFRVGRTEHNQTATR